MLVPMMPVPMHRMHDVAMPVRVAAGVGAGAVAGGDGGVVVAAPDSPRVA